MTNGAHKRQNLLTGDWVLVSPHRLMRPWQGSVSDVTRTPATSHDPNCYLCAGNQRSAGQRNPQYAGVYVFENDFPALLEKSQPPESDAILIAEPETGICRVICYSPDHSRAMSGMPPSNIEQVIETWAVQYAELSERPDIASVTIFENRGEMMGASNPHPHGQIWATRSTPNELARESTRQSAWLATHGRPLLLDYLERELRSGERVVCANEHFVVVTPFWAAWPFETLLLPRRAVGDLTELHQAERKDLANVLSDLTRLYDAVFDAPFPYTMGWHQRPTRALPDSGFVLHAHFYPPLLRSASIRKFMVGFEMLGMPQRDLTPEEAVTRLREAKSHIVKPTRS
jgi:UDPglucose--hexose-1-phosphate uridylyltransferase